MMDALTLFKALGDDTRLKILRALREKEGYVELLAERLQLTNATISFHMKKLLAAGLVTARREQYYTIYTLSPRALQEKIADLVFPEGQRDAQAEKRELAYRDKVIRTFMPCGYCETMPAQQKKRLIIYEEIFRRFEEGRVYPEREVNRIIEEIHGDYCTVRRDFIGLGWMSRDRQGNYTVLGCAEGSSPT